ncbi:MAG TPA: hypothetical protein PLR83_00330 [Pyrinomonadaceae bacterium]|nr:hypothetical protein [Pyrinomonadaceae bacterium]
MELKQNKLRQLEIGRRRGWVVYLAYTAKPMPLTFNTLIELLDARNMPLTHRRFAEHLDFLRSIGFVKIFPIANSVEISNLEQTKIIQAYCDNDGDGGDGYCIGLTTRGINFQEGHFEETGVLRMN